MFHGHTHKKETGRAVRFYSKLRGKSMLERRLLHQQFALQTRALRVVSYDPLVLAPFLITEPALNIAGEHYEYRCLYVEPQPASRIQSRNYKPIGFIAARQLAGARSQRLPKIRYKCERKYVSQCQHLSDYRNGQSFTGSANSKRRARTGKVSRCPRLQR